MKTSATQKSGKQLWAFTTPTVNTPANWVIHFARSLKPQANSSPRKPPRDLGLVIRGRIRSILCKQGAHSGFTNVAQDTGKHSRSNQLKASTSDYANTIHRSNPHRH